MTKIWPIVVVGGQIERSPWTGASGISDTRVGCLQAHAVSPGSEPIQIVNMPSVPSKLGSGLPGFLGLAFVVFLFIRFTEKTICEVYM